MNYLKIDNSTYYAFYAHLSEIGSGISTDSEVKKGDTIGKTGATGNASSLTGDDLHLHFECRTEVSPGLGLVGRESPNKIVETKFYTQNDAVNANGEYTSNQTNSGVKKVESDGTETLMSVE